MFSQLTLERIGSYVYALRHPDTKEVFYVGKGTGNRVFSHAEGNIEQDKNKEKIAIIKQIQATGKSVDCWIVRYGLTAEIALEVEAALIDFIGLEKLSNNVKGHNVERGIVSCVELDLKLGAEAIQVQHPLMVIKINASYTSGMSYEEIYKATREYWVASIQNVRKIEYVVAVSGGIVREVFKPNEWYRSDTSNRVGFKGERAPEHIRNLYFHKRINEINLKGSANPIRYLFPNQTTQPCMVEEKSQESCTWNGTTKQGIFNSKFGEEIRKVYGFVNDKDWVGVLGCLRLRPEMVNWFEPDNASGSTLLHKCVEHNCSIDTIEQLIGLGAWTAIKDAQGKTPLQLAKLYKKEELYDVLALKKGIEITDDLSCSLEKNLHFLINQISGDSIREHGVIMPQVDVLNEISPLKLWFPVPGMYGGFNLHIESDNGVTKLISESWSRIVGDSLQRHEITENGIALVFDEGSE